MPVAVKSASPTLSDTVLPEPSSKDQWCSKDAPEGIHASSTTKALAGTGVLLKLDVDHASFSP